MNDVAKLVEQVITGPTQLRTLFDDPSSLPLSAIAEDIARLEHAMDKNAYIDAAFAQVCAISDAGKLVGANYPDAYLMEKLDISRGEAYNRLARAKAMFAPVAEPDRGDLSDVEEAERRRKGQEHARHSADTVSAAKQDIIRRETDKLLKAAEGEHMRIYAHAMEEAKTRDEKDLRLTVKRLVDKANRPHARKNPNAGFEKREATLGKENSDGTYYVRLDMTAGDYALYKALTDKGLAPNSNIPLEHQQERDPRSRGQRRYDQFMAIRARRAGHQRWRRLRGGLSDSRRPRRRRRHHTVPNQRRRGAGRLRTRAPRHGWHV